MNKLVKISFIILGMIFGSATANAQDFNFNLGLSGVVTNLQAKGEESEGNVSPVETTSRSEDLFAAYGEVFIELDLGMLSFGLSRAQDLESETTERTNDNSDGDSNTNKVQVDIEDITTFYIKADLPADVAGGNLYVRAGMVSADLITNENLGTGSIYGDAELEGYVGGIGYERDLDQIFVRAEGNISAYDPISLVSQNNTDNRIKVNSLDGYTIQFSVGKSF